MNTEPTWEDWLQACLLIALFGSLVMVLITGYAEGWKW